MQPDKKILIGEITGAQGMRGEVRIHFFTEQPADLEKFQIIDFPHKIKFLRLSGNSVAICKISEIDDRTSAENMAGTKLFINRAALPTPKPGEHYIVDLIGMTVGKQTVIAVHNFGAGDILELDNGEMISFNDATVNYKTKEIVLRVIS